MTCNHLHSTLEELIDYVIDTGSGDLLKVEQGKKLLRCFSDKFLQSADPNGAGRQG
jgi:hypothetical protein